MPSTLKGSGEKHIKTFYEEGLIQSPPDIFTLKARDARSSTRLAEREGWGALSAGNLFDAIDARRNIRLDRLIYALGLRHVGETTARLLARHYGRHRCVL